MDHRKEAARSEFSRVEDARPDRWISVAYAKKVEERAGTKLCPHDSLSVQEVWTCGQRRFQIFFEDKGTYEIPQGSHLVLLRLLWCSQ